VSALKHAEKNGSKLSCLVRAIGDHFSIPTAGAKITNQWTLHFSLSPFFPVWPACCAAGLETVSLTCLYRSPAVFKSLPNAGLQGFPGHDDSDRVLMAVLDVRIRP
jgi:hypothetical protein